MMAVSSGTTVKGLDGTTINGSSSDLAVEGWNIGEQGGFSSIVTQGNFGEISLRDKYVLAVLYANFGGNFSLSQVLYGCAMLSELSFRNTGTNI